LLLPPQPLPSAKSLETCLTTKILSSGRVASSTLNTCVP
jgi:hypothetical protein